MPQSALKWPSRSSCPQRPQKVSEIGTNRISNANLSFKVMLKVIAFQALISTLDRNCSAMSNRLGKVQTPIFGEMEGRRGSAVTPFARSTVVSYTLSIVLLLRYL